MNNLLVVRTPRGVPELKREWKVKITEGGKSYTLTLKLFKSRLNIEDEDGNRIAVDKRDNWIKIERWGNVNWHREKR